MHTPVRLAVAAVFACGFAALASGPASAMPIAKVGVDAPPITEEVHAVKVCRYGRCWWSASHYHGPRYGWRRGYRYGWRHPHYRHYGYRHGYRHY